MPISKNGKPYYTKEQYEFAKKSRHTLEYARARGYELVRQGQWYKMRGHDSMVFTPDGRWFWNSRALSGGELAFMVYYEGIPVNEAVLQICGERAAPEYEAPKHEAPAARVPFRLPNRAENFKCLFGYLCGRRGIEKSVLQEMIRQQRVYQSEECAQSGKIVCNAVFVYRDEQGTPVGAYKRGMSDKSNYKMNVPGSDKRFGWLLASPQAPATQVRVFEAAIDAASDASLDAMRLGSAWRTEPVDRLSLEGLTFQPLQSYLQSHPQVRDVRFMLDRDEPGLRAATAFSQRAASLGCETQLAFPQCGKDWNDALRITLEMQEALQVESEVCDALL